MYTARNYLEYLAAALFSFYNVFEFALLNTINSHFSKTMHLTSVQMGFFASCYLWANALSLIPMGFLLDHYSLRKVAIFFFTLTSLANFGIALSHSLWIDSLLRFGQGLSSSTSLLLSMRLATRKNNLYPHVMVGGIIAFALAGGMIANNVFIYEVNALGWQLSLIITGVIGLILTLFMGLFLLEEAPSQKIATVFNRYTVLFLYCEIKEIINKPFYWIAGIYLGLMNAPIFILAALWGNIYLIHLYTITTTQTASLSALIFLGVMMGSPILGLVADRWGSKLVMYLGCGLALGLSLVFLWNERFSLELLMMLLLGLGLAASTQNIAYNFISRHSLPHQTSIATGMAALIANSIGACLQILFGELLQEPHFLGTSSLFLFPDHTYFLNTLLFPIAFLFCIPLAIYLNRASSQGH